MTPGRTERDTLEEMRRKFLLDGAIALVVLVLSLGMLSRRGDLDGLGFLLGAFASLPLVFRRRSPLGVFAATAAASTALMALGYPPGPPLGATVALFFLAAGDGETRAPRWLAPITVVGFLFLHAAAVGFAEDEFPTVPLLFGTLVWGAAWVVGDRIRRRRAQIADLEERVRHAEREAERERRLAAAEERAQIARDLHDSAGHAINVILVQAGAARLLQEQDPERARAAIETVEEVARETIGEIDQLVRALREDGTGEGVEPPPGLAALNTLADRHRSAGLPVTISISGERRSLPAGVDRAAYRILQEALVNASRHGSGRADVELVFRPDALEITVANPVGSDAPNGGGHGLVGMRERAALLGGSLDALASDGVFRVLARLPYAEGA
jgi:signal transduction histidine kinase